MIETDVVKNSSQSMFLEYLIKVGASNNYNLVRLYKVKLDKEFEKSKY